MPLPAALAARLAKRGLLANSKKSESKKEPKRRVLEEVIAEDYDHANDEFVPTIIAQKFMGYHGCPNKYNIHHECSMKCKEIWGKGHMYPSERYIKMQERLLEKYPLPENWKAVYDPGCGQHYYWDVSADLVSWMPPGHPKCQISQPASQLREELHMKAAEEDNQSTSNESGSESEDEEMESDEEDNNKDQSVTDNRAKPDKPTEKYRGPDPRRVARVPSGRDKDGKKDRTLDPMDPAAYSDIPRGKWSDGLVRGNEAKTGVDSTASGPLFQMRPYPSPGAVLRSNKTQKEETESSTKMKVSFPEKPA